MAMNLLYRNERQLFYLKNLSILLIYITNKIMEVLAKKKNLTKIIIFYLKKTVNNQQFYFFIFTYKFKIFYKNIN
jgi:hypothetical protein